MIDYDKRIIIRKIHFTFWRTKLELQIFCSMFSLSSFDISLKRIIMWKMTFVKLNERISMLQKWKKSIRSALSNWDAMYWFQTIWWNVKLVFRKFVCLLVKHLFQMSHVRLLIVYQTFDDQIWADIWDRSEQKIKKTWFLKHAMSAIWTKNV